MSSAYVVIPRVLPLREKGGVRLARDGNNLQLGACRCLSPTMPSAYVVIPRVLPLREKGGVRLAGDGNNATS